MIQCPQCKKELPDGTAFCDECGTKIEPAFFCPNCGTQASKSAAFCGNCGFSFQTMTQPQPQPQPQPEPQPEFQPQPQPSKAKTAKTAVTGFFSGLMEKISVIPKKFLALGGGAVALLLVAVILLSIFLTGGPNNYALYIKDGELYYADVDNFEPFEVTDNLYDTDYALAKLSSDGKTLFYLDETYNTSGSVLYYRSVNDPDEEPIKVDSNVDFFVINNSGDIVTYFKKDTHTLYQHDLNERTKIASDVADFAVTPDGETVLYTIKKDDETNLYYKEWGEDAVKIASDIQYVAYVSEDLETVYYTKGGTKEDDSTAYKDYVLYKSEDGEEGIKIASDINYAIVFDSGEIYYTKSETQKIDLADYVNDTYKDSDATMVMPTRPQYPSYTWGMSNEEWNELLAKYNNDVAAYNTAYDAYQDKLDRDSIRKQLNNMSFDFTNYTLYYLDDGEEAIKVCDNFSSFEATGINRAVICYSAYTLSGEIEKVNIDDIDYAEQIEYMVRDAFEEDKEYYAAVKSTASKLDIGENEYLDSYITFDESDEYLYYLVMARKDDDDTSDTTVEDSGNLMRVDVSKDAPGTPAVYDNEVADYVVYADENVVYYKNVKDSQGDLYVNTEKVDSDVYTGRFYYDVNNDNMTYFVDYNAEKEKGTLKQYDGDESVEVASDVHRYVVTPDGQILFLADYNLDRSKGDLYLYDGGKPEKVDEDVSNIIFVYSETKDTDYFVSTFYWYN